MILYTYRNAHCLTGGQQKPPMVKTKLPTFSELLRRMDTGDIGGGVQEAMELVAPFALVTLIPPCLIL